MAFNLEGWLIAIIILSVFTAGCIAMGVCFCEPKTRKEMQGLLDMFGPPLFGLPFVLFCIIILVNELAAIPIAIERKEATERYNDQGTPLICKIESVEEFKCDGICVYFVYTVSYNTIQNRTMTVKCMDTGCINGHRSLTDQITCFKVDSELVPSFQRKSYFDPLPFIVMRWIWVGYLSLCFICVVYIRICIAWKKIENRKRSRKGRVKEKVKEKKKEEPRGKEPRERERKPEERRETTFEPLGEVAIEPSAPISVEPSAPERDLEIGDGGEPSFFETQGEPSVSEIYPETN